MSYTGYSCNVNGINTNGTKSTTKTGYIASNEKN